MRAYDVAPLGTRSKVGTIESTAFVCGDRVFPYGYNLPVVFRDVQEVTAILRISQPPHESTLKTEPFVLVGSLDATLADFVVGDVPMLSFSCPKVELRRHYLSG